LALEVSEADDATTVAFATGLPLVLSVTVPVTAPVVPASAHVPWASIPMRSSTANSGLKKLTFFNVAVLSEV
jgi:hypothetical protein